MEEGGGGDRWESGVALDRDIGRVCGCVWLQRKEKNVRMFKVVEIGISICNCMVFYDMNEC
ncbi:hypothetical protein Csa_004371 [Cucumis sativus]|uniref:Uncharacterized protein n=1 Tax=Cucumis sativus TaxID=3659 RepID=A0A0A0KIK4_CUCSA|nr:hypothetical protein Csa_004371 [Cucumis sativus]